ncbi:VCBS repeat-containing protein [Massilia sp. CCM 8734]|uniref:FG-GAP repeat domain-containing protein n=1 Tax=Massilia sp. CCM 8734 TaxID=2609283 RepID=UPI001420AC2D|nr:VCBS repeat-containing protein [Massilia sp. CCM 8734]NHZ96257.1 hypothetical protein [Massilia sp. CCM 8734]
MLLLTPFKHLQAAVLFVAAAVMFMPDQAHAAIPASWCTHSSAQWLTGDVDGDGRLDAVCHDRSTGVKWVALAEATGLEERWSNTTIGFCSHAGATLYIGDINGDRRADLLCKDANRLWIDYAGADFYGGTDFWLDTNYCTHAGALTFLADQNGDGRADLVCRDSAGHVWIDLADPAGRFADTDLEGVRPDFELFNITRALGGGYILHVRNNGIVGNLETARCTPSTRTHTLSRRMEAGAVVTVIFPSIPRDAVPTCSVRGRGVSGAAELFISNNQLSKFVP